MRKFEYMTLTYRNSVLGFGQGWRGGFKGSESKVLSELGLQGWELVSVNIHYRSAIFFYEAAYYYLKREL